MWINFYVEPLTLRFAFAWVPSTEEGGTRVQWVSGVCGVSDAGIATVQVKYVWTRYKYYITVAGIATTPRPLRNATCTTDEAQSIILLGAAVVGRYLCLLFDEMTMITHFQIEHFSFIFFPYYVFVLTNTEEWFILCFVIHITFFFFILCVFCFSQQEHGRWDWGQEKWREE